MKTRKVYLSRYRRKREKKTDYRRRLKLLKSGSPRLVVRPSTHIMSVQVIAYDQNGDRTLAEASSKELSKFGWKGDEDNVAASFLTGLLLARKVGEKGLKFEKLIPDLGMHAPHKGGKVFALLMGAAEGGLPVSMSEDVELDESALRMEPLAEYTRELKEKDPQGYSRRFSRYLARGLEPYDLPAHFDEVRKQLGGAVV